MEADCLILGNLLDGRGEGGGAAEGLRCLAVFLYQRDHKICCVYLRREMFRKHLVTWLTHIKIDRFTQKRY